MTRLKVELAPGLVIDHSVSEIDENHLLYGNFIGVQYVFDSVLNETYLANSITKLVTLFPALAGRYDAKSQTIIGPTNGLFLEVNNTGTAFAAHTKFGSIQSHRREFVHEPNRRDVLGGNAPLATFTLTKFDEGCCILGVAISHVLTDAAGLHFVMYRLAQIYSDLKAGNKSIETSVISHLDVFTFGTDRTKSETTKALTQAGLKRPMKIKGLVGGVLKKIVVGAMDKMAQNSRIVVYFSASDVARLKETVLLESGEDWISTNVALSAHFTKIMAKLMYGDREKTNIQIGQLLDLRGRYFEKDRNKQDEYVGNAILIHTSKANFVEGVQHTPRGELASWFKKNLSAVDARYLQNRLDLIVDCLKQGNSYVGLELKNPMIALNNQSKMPVYNLKFGDDIPARVIPQDVGDNIMFFPTNDGGIEIYIRDILNPKRQQKLLTNEWQERIFDF